MIYTYIYLFIMVASTFRKSLDFSQNGKIFSKIYFTPKGGKFGENNFLRYLGLCYVNPAY